MELGMLYAHSAMRLTDFVAFETPYCRSQIWTDQLTAPGSMVRGQPTMEKVQCGTTCCRASPFTSSDETSELGQLPSRPSGKGME